MTEYGSSRVGPQNTSMWATRTGGVWYRRALSTSFCCGWLRPVENVYTTVPPSVAAGLPKRAQELLGYALYDASAVGGGYLGYHDMGDPMRLFD